MGVLKKTIQYIFHLSQPRSIFKICWVDRKIAVLKGFSCVSSPLYQDNFYMLFPTLTCIFHHCFLVCNPIRNFYQPRITHLILHIIVCICRINYAIANILFTSCLVREFLLWQLLHIYKPIQHQTVAPKLSIQIGYFHAIHSLVFFVPLTCFLKF